MEGIKGKDIVACFNTVNGLWREIETMADRLTIMLRKEIDENGLRCAGEPDDKLDYKYFDDNYSDVCIGYIINIAAKSPKKKRPDVYFGFQVSLADNLINVPRNDEPIIFMFAAAEPMGFDDAWHMYFPMTDEFDTNFKVENETVLRWNDGSIAYGVPLLSLNNEADLQDLCVTPLLRLKKGENSEAVFDKKLNERIIKFPKKETLIS